MRIFKEMFLANLKELIRDKSGLFWLIAFPIIFVFIFGIVFSGGGEQSFNVGIVVESQTPVTERILDSMKSVSSFNIFIETENKGEELKNLEEGNRSLVMVLPDIKYRDLSQNKSFDISLYYDNTRQQTTQVLLSVIKEIFNNIERQATQREKIFNIKSEPVQAQNLSHFDYVLPGILGMAIMQLGLFGSFNFLRLRKQKIIRGLAVTPLPRTVLLMSEISVRLIVALVQTFLILFIGQIVFGVSVVGSILKLVGMAILGAMTFISLGYMLISFANSMESGEGLVQVVQFPMMFLSGIFFPVGIMPDYIKPIVKVIPLTYLGDAFRQIMVGAPPEYTMMTNILVLLGWLLVTVIVTIKFWRWE